MYRDKTLVVLLSMGRSGSSFTTRLLQRLGMSLGPFELLGAHESNPYGHYEALPFVLLNRELMQQAFGYPDDYTIPQEIIQQFLASDGRLPADIEIAERHLHWGKDIVQKLIDSGPVSGFKDPRTVLIWPFWQRVFEHFPGLKVVPFCLLRSPHEIAMSYYRRAQAAYSYDLVLDMTKIQLRRLKDIVDTWPGELAQAQFDPKLFAQQAEQAVEKCGLKWDPVAFAEAYDADCRHNRPVRIAHEAQELFQQLGGACEQTSEHMNLQNMMADASLREQVLRARLQGFANVEQENVALKEKIALQQAALDKVATEKGMTQAQLYAIAAEKASSQARLKALEAEKLIWDRYRQSRGWAMLVAAWKLRQRLIPVNSRREAAAKIAYQSLRSLYRRVRRGAERTTNGRNVQNSSQSPRRAA